MDEILDYCLKVDGVTSFFPIYNEADSTPLKADPAMAKKYGWNNGKVSFVTEDGSYYVTPYCFEVAEALREMGYEETGIYVPFSNGDIPQDKQLAEKWERLCADARKKHDEMRKREKEKHLKEVADKKMIRDLPEDVYKLSLRIPEEGLETTWMGSEKDVTRPVSEWKVDECMGTYCGNNGKISFVDSKGDTYVTPFYFEVGEILRNSGYNEGSLFVPLSNGEDIVDPAIAARWKIMCEEARKLFNKRQEENNSSFRM